ncbi:DEAD/DEAH box helicase [Longispora albida]|uniref:DEAD/DEAH box helicase n=1 Tax=Longispora albida TaxID=203523 RepID=UPI00036DDDCB|nr:DEAD/DEAH box helicase family protein [Longispora albida]
MSWLPFDAALVEEISARMDLRAPNAAALRVAAQEIEPGDGREVVCDLATGVGKTYLAAALVDYLAAQGVRNILIVTPGTTIQDKTVDNFTQGHPKFVPGAEYQPLLITSENFSRGQVGDALHDDTVVKLFVFNVQQLIKPTVNTSRKVRATDEFIGQGLYDHLRDTDDLVVIADEHHVYKSSAKAFGNAVRELGPRALVGLTATPDDTDLDKVRYRYTLAEAIADGLVKIPVIVYREDGIKDVRTQLADACHLRDRKEAVWRSWAEHNGRASVTPVLFVVCQSIADAERVAETLTGDGYLPGDGQVLLITSQSSDKALADLAAVENPSSPVRAVVSVDKLKEGWDVKNIGVIVGFRALASQTLTEQILGRGLRLPFGERVGVPAIDQVDLVAHDSYRQLLAQKNALLQQVVPPAPESTSTATPAGSQGPLPFGAKPEPDVSGVQEVESQGSLHLVGPAREINGQTIDGSELLLLTSLDAAAAQHERDRQAASKILYKVDGAPSIRFPRREREVMPVHFSLSYVENAAAQAEGAGYASEFPVHLTRKALIAQRGIDGEVVVREQRVKEEDATQRYVAVADVRQDLEDRILNLGLVEQSLPELNGARRIAEQFLLGAQVTADDEDKATLWSERRAEQAVKAIAELIQSSYNNRRLQPQWALRPVEVPLRKPMPSDVGSRWEDFIKHRWYGDWERSIQQVASFDAKTTEWAIASLIDSSRKVHWWLRVYEPGEVWIERDNSKKYFPDFIVLDADGVYWVVEGKSDRDAHDVDVIDKKRNAEEWARFVRDHQKYGVWRYVFATETHIKQSKSWEELLAKTKPEL